MIRLVKYKSDIDRNFGGDAVPFEKAALEVDGKVVIFSKLNGQIVEEHTGLTRVQFVTKYAGDLSIQVI